MKNNLAQKSHVQEGLFTQRYRKLRLGRTLRDLGYLDQNSLNQALIQFLKSNSQLEVSEISQKLKEIKLSPQMKSWCVDRELVPLPLSGPELAFLCTSFNDEWIEEGEKLWNCDIALSVVSDEIYQYAKSIVFNAERKNSARLFLTESLTDDRKLAGDNPYTRLYRECIDTAKRDSISDVHIEPKPDSIQIRFRRHGDLTPWKILGKEHREPLTNKVKWLTNLDLSVRGRAQDSRATYYDLHLNLRVSAIPTRHGDKIVLRILDQDKEFDIDNVGLPTDAVADLRNVANLPNGLIIISGPTGSGKTTTLYGLINSLDHRRKNITTLEDPSEYELRGVTQTEIGKNLTFASALKALLRQDPDVILLGEIRDEETAHLSFKIANTGHLVITTLHSNGALESIERLKAMGIDDFSIRSCLRMTGAQRLVQTLCPDCSKEFSRKGLGTVSETLLSLEQKFGGSQRYRIRNEEGCNHCFKGINGRLPILEYALGSQIVNRQLRTSLREAAFKLAREGRVDVRDVSQIA